ncbi:MAG: M20/M25/M40 family metallo-hydrolase, partial [Calditrichaeota bacterium]
MSEPYPELWKKIEGYRDDMIEMQRQLCAMPALSPENGGDGETQKAEWLLNFIREWPFSILEVIKAPDDRVSSGYRPNIIAVLPGEDQSTTLWLMAHTDVVPPGDPGKWSGDPWALRIDGDKLIGRGTEDNQQGIVSSIFAAKAFVDLGL